MSKIGIIKCKNYEYEKVLGSVHTSLEGLDSVKKMKPGKVLVKVNLLKKNKPEDGVTTHPYVVEGVVRFLQERGHDVTIGDSPGGPFLARMLKVIYDASGMTEVAERTGCKLNFDTDSIDIHNESAMYLKNMKVVKAFTEII